MAFGGLSPRQGHLERLLELTAGVGFDSKVRSNGRQLKRQKWKMESAIMSPYPSASSRSDSICF
jgi:hypothetical protein